NVGKSLFLDLRQEHCRARDRARDQLRKEDDVEKGFVKAGAAGLRLACQVYQEADIVEDEKRNADRKWQTKQKIGNRIARGNRRRIEKQELVFEKREQAEIECDSNRQPDRAVPPRQEQEQVRAEHGKREHRQQLRLAVAVEKQACQYQQIGLERTNRRQIVGHEDDRDKKGERPGREGHTLPCALRRRTLTLPQGCAHPWKAS